MSEQVYWVVKAAIRTGQYDTLLDLMKEMVATCEANEPATLNYEWSVSADKATLHIFERYETSAAVVAHLKWFGAEWAERFVAAAEPKSLTVYGAPDASAKKALDRLGAAYFTPIGGFSR